jgi:hypothetical protein
LAFVGIFIGDSAHKYRMSTSYIYIIGSDTPPYKVGISKDPGRRLKSLQTGHPRKLRILDARATDAEKTKLLETAIHQQLKFYKTHGEWFDIKLDALKLEVEHAIIRWAEDPLLGMHARHRWF